MSELRDEAMALFCGSDLTAKNLEILVTVEKLLAENERLEVLSAADIEIDGYRHAASQAVADYVKRLRGEREELLAENERMRSAGIEWLKKTEWVQEGMNNGQLPARYLGWHRADVINAEIERLRKELAVSESAIEHWKGECAHGEARLRELANAEPVAWMTDHKSVCNNGITKCPGDASAWKLEGWRVQSLIRRPEVPRG